MSGKKEIIMAGAFLYMMLFPFILGCATLFFVGIGNATIDKMDVGYTAIISVFVTIAAVYYFEKCANDPQ